MFYQPHSVVAFHSCDREVGLDVLNGRQNLIESQNVWDWLGAGVYFWEQNPTRAWEYALESSQLKQFNKKAIKTPFVLGALIELGNCLNLVDADSLRLLKLAHSGLARVVYGVSDELPINRGSDRRLDCAVLQYLHQSYEASGEKTFDSVRCAFPEGEAAYPNSAITSRLHLQICVRNPDCIKGFFLPRPIGRFNPFV